MFFDVFINRVDVGGMGDWVCMMKKYGDISNIGLGVFLTECIVETV